MDWATSGIYPTADGWCPPSWPTNEDHLAFEEKQKARIKRRLVKRTAVILHKHINTVVEPDFMDRNRYSLQVWPLREASKLSGRGEQRSYACWVYYDPQDEQSVFRAFSSVDANLKASEREVVDPDTSIKNEEKLLFAKGQQCYFSMYEWDAVQD
eukprot:TRINITY_DN107453_c0_g1_i1.p1 TRINITY_DN107453_c0_g1~~TRINITY_DN107453_c0_g1_i1.p1  ORF type:complete len:155 (-),score=30.17 TRINITY_DN107453_c0_g1_i1:60-524(-)